MASRSGKTIIEVLVVISVFAALMTPIGRLLHTMMRSEREGVQALTASVSGSRLAREFRSDVHAARDVETAADENGPGELRLIHDDGTAVTYRAGDRRMQRIVARGDEVLSRESFRLPAGTSRFEVLEEPRIVVLLHEHSATTGSQESRGTDVLRVEAVPGRDHRFGNQD